MLTVNLWDANFTQAACSVAFQVPEHVRYVRDQLEFDGVTFFTDEYINSPVVEKVKCKYKIAWLREPYCLHPLTYERAWDNRHKFDAVLTYYNPFLAADHHFHYVPYGGVWIDKGEWGLRRKTKNISMLFGEKALTEGHQLRHKIFDHLGYQPWIDYYGKYGTPTDYSAATKLKVLKDYKYSIVIETCREEGLFTEILLDCFAVGTIPIFWGAPDISDYFYSTSILSFEGIDDLDDVLNSIEDYRYYETYARENLRRVEEYAVTEDWIYEHVLKQIS